jgi:hypothetical protein
MFLMLLTAMLSGSLYSNLMVTPSRVEVKLDKPMTQMFSVYNKGDKKVTLAVEPYYKEVDKNKLMDPSTAGADDLSKYIKIAPKVIKVGPKKSRAIRVSIRPTAELKAKKGEYKVHILFRNIDVDEEVKKVATDKKTKRPDIVSLSGELKVNVAVPVYASVGDENVEIKVDCYVDGETPRIKVVNYGLWRFDGWVRFYNEKGVQVMDARVFMPRQSIEFVSIKKDVMPIPMKTEFVPLDKKKKTLAGNLCSFGEQRPASVAKPAASPKPAAKPKALPAVAAPKKKKA